LDNPQIPSQPPLIRRSRETPTTINLELSDLPIGKLGNLVTVLAMIAEAIRAKTPTRATNRDIRSASPIAKIRIAGKMQEAGQ
jgi:hypothetical protein